jgi:predicted O-methyltransferase YrrM
MLENINAPGFETLSTADASVCENVAALIADGAAHPIVAEIGVGVGATSRELATILDNHGELHLFDFEGKIRELVADLGELGYHNIIGFGNTRRHWDSYNWSLIKQIERVPGPVYDYIYLDGAHTVTHDALAFFLCDRLLKVGGCIDFDDYFWSVSKSRWMANDRYDFMTEEQVQEQQIKLVIDTLVVPDPRYAEITPNKVYRKIA